MKKENRKILIVEINKDSEDEMIKGFCTQKDVLLKCKVLEMHKNMESYKNHIKEEQISIIKTEQF